MFIKVVKKKNSGTGKVFHQFTLAQNARVGGKVKQNNILFLGSEIELLEKGLRHEVLLQLQGKINGTPLIFDDFSSRSVELANIYFEKFQIKYAAYTDYSEVVSSPPKPDASDYQEVDVNSLQVLTSKSYGAENIAHQTYHKLGLERILTSFGWDKAEIKMAELSILSRTIYSSSEHKTAQILKHNSSLKDILGIDKNLTHRDLYPILDKLYDNRAAIDKALYSNISHLFQIDGSIVIYDLSNLYFEGRKSGSKLSKFGRNKDKRNDCKQVVFTGIIDSEGFIKHSKIYEGNMVDCKTIEDLLGDFQKHGVDLSKVTIVMDAGFATEDNLALLQSKGMKYVCVARQKVKNFVPDSTKGIIQVLDKNKNPIHLQIFQNEAKNDIWMYVNSEQKRIKENSMKDKLEQRFEEELQALNISLTKKGTTKLVEKVWVRIGRMRERHKGVSGRYNLNVIADNGKATAITWEKSAAKSPENSQSGVYFIRTNLLETSEERLWQVYNLVREVESTFRCLKSDLLIRPIYHQRDQRIEGHIYQTILSYQIVNAIRFQLKIVGIQLDWTNIVRILKTQTLNEILLPTKTKNLVIIKPSKPIVDVQNIYKALAIPIILKSKKKYVEYH